MAVAQLTFRESLRDIEACLRSQSEKLYHMGIRGQVSRNTLANANATRDWRIYADFAQRLLGIARKLYINGLFVQGKMAGRAVFSLDQNAFAREGILWNLGKRCEVANLDRCVGLRARRHHQKAPQTVSQPVRNATDIEPQPVRENSAGYSAFAYSDGPKIRSRWQPADSSLKTLGQA